MWLRHWFRPEIEPSEGGVVTFRRQLLALLAVFTFYGVSPLLLLVPVPHGPALMGFAVVGWGMTLAGVTFMLSRRWPRASSWFFVLGSLSLYVLILLVFRQPIVLPLFAVPVLIGGLLLGTFSDLFILILALVSVFYLGRTMPQANNMLFWVIFLSFASGFSVLTGQALKLIDYWERELVVRQEKLVVQLRERQGELNRTLKALDEAYVSLKRTNDELVVARQQAEEARALKEQFVANVSHELRTPLNLIMGFAEMMYLSPESYAGVVWTPTLEGDIHEIYHAGRHLQSLVNDILDLSRIDAARLPMFRELQDVRMIIAEAAETVAPLFKQHGLTYDMIWPDELPQLFVDRTRIRQVMLNLLNNAVRYTDKGGISVKVEQTAEAVVVSVHDTGIGIPESQLDSIFEEFRQADAGPRGRGGVGLGLALSRQFVELHGGRLWVESQVGVGSTFSFSLPLPGAVPQTVSLHNIPDRRRVDLSRAPVVVVDRDPSIAEMLSRYLDDRPVLGAEDLREAEAMIEEQHPLAVIVNQPPDVPSEAWLGPLGTFSERCGVPVFRCSIASPSWLQQADGIRDCLTKPITREALIKVLERYCVQPSVILVVDDDPGFVRLMVRMLENIDLVSEVLTAYTGAQAISLARERVPDLVLLDLLMPEVDGFEVLRALRNTPALRDTVVVAVTATSYAEEILLRRGSYFTLTQSLGISPGMLVELLNAGLKMVRPNYMGEERSESSA